ncbi:hypothetical protein DE146DRAFT_761679 [Phaeosphaeria sp. MPI-PUGE-AT-0046c]|nr:hypothetical protein DE146DRAFT_761679 [Phaeosphaeria sp. MPI-PUGE-AT-0046c]
MAPVLRNRAKIPKPQRLIDEIENAPKKKRSRRKLAAAPPAPLPSASSSLLAAARSGSSPPEYRKDGPTPAAPPFRAVPAGTWQQLPAELRLQVYRDVGYSHKLRPIPSSQIPGDTLPALYCSRTTDSGLKGAKRELYDELRCEERQLLLQDLYTDIIIHEDDIDQVEPLMELLKSAAAGQAHVIERGGQVGTSAWRDLAITRPIINYLDRRRGNFGYISLGDIERGMLEDWLEMQLAYERNRRPGAKGVSFRIIFAPREVPQPGTQHHVNNNTPIGLLDNDLTMRIVAVIGPTVTTGEMELFMIVIEGNTDDGWTPQQLDYGHARSVERALF